MGEDGKAEAGRPRKVRPPLPCSLRSRSALTPVIQEHRRQQLWCA